MLGGPGGYRVRVTRRLGGAGDDAEGYRITMAIFSALAVVFFLVTFFTTRERIQPPPDQTQSIGSNAYADALVTTYHDDSYVTAEAERRAFAPDCIRGGRFLCVSATRTRGEFPGPRPLAPLG